MNEWSRSSVGAGPARRCAGFAAPPSARALLPALLLSCVSVGCDDPLVDPATLIGPRVLGAQVSVLSAPNVAEPLPGEDARIAWLLGADSAAPLSVRLAFCSAEASVLGTPRCAGPVWDEQRVLGAFGEPLRADFSLPAELEPGSSWLVWLGWCEEGEARFDARASSFGCAGSGESLQAFYRGRIPEAAPNQNPALADDLLFLDDVPWPDTPDAPAAGEPCVDSDLLRLTHARPASIRFELGGDDREPLPTTADAYAGRPRESLVYTHIATRSGLGRAFSAIDHDALETGFLLPLTLGADPVPASDGQSVSLYLIAHDERGGVDWLRRDACLVP
jgi:hypothetical protein